MKKLIVVCEILILFIFLAKIVAVGGILKISETADRLMTVDHASADSPVVGDNDHPVKDVCKDSLLQERELLSSLLEKQKELKDRERLLSSEEKRLNSLKNEILSRINKLREMEEKLSGLLETIKETDNNRYKDLAKVYESTPPARASSMLEKLDKRTAAAIIMNMKSKKAGAIMGHINPTRAAEITKEITSTCLPSFNSR